jgi:hypothetical protein
MLRIWCEDLVCQPILDRDGGNIGSVLSPHFVSLMKLVELRKKEGSSLPWWMSRRRTKGGEDQEAESSRSSLGNHNF